MYILIKYSIFVRTVNIVSWISDILEYDHNHRSKRNIYYVVYVCMSVGIEKYSIQQRLTQINQRSFFKVNSLEKERWSEFCDNLKRKKRMIHELYHLLCLHYFLVLAMPMRNSHARHLYWYTTVASEQHPYSKPAVQNIHNRNTHAYIHT